MTPHNALAETAIEKAPPKRFALMSRAVLNADGLFRHVPRAKAEKRPLLATWRSIKDPTVSVKFSGRVSLITIDAIVLCALVSLAGKRWRKPLEEKERTKDFDLFAEVNQGLNAQCEVRSSLRELAKSAGYKESGAGKTLSAIKDSLTALSQVTVLVDREGENVCRGAHESHSMVEVAWNDANELTVSFSALLATAFLGSTKAYTRVDLFHMAKLPPKSPARLLAFRLSWLDPKEARLVSIETLGGYVWPDKELDRKDRWRVHEAMKVLGQKLGDCLQVTRVDGKNGECYMIHRKPIDLSELSPPERHRLWQRQRKTLAS